MTMYGLPAADAVLTQGDIIDRCPIIDWEEVGLLVQLNVLKPATVKDQIRTHRVFGLYFLPAFGDVLPESIVDLRDIHTLPRELLEQLVVRGQRTVTINTPFREHLAQHFAVTFSRIALPEPYETKPIV